MSGTGKLVGVGVGPGDPDLLTIKAARMIKQADVVAHFAKAGRASNARSIVAGQLEPGVTELPLHYPVTTEIASDSPDYCGKLRAFHDQAAAMLSVHLDRGRTVAVICEGDPLFYGSYMHLHARLAARYPTEIIPGVTGMSGCWSASGTPIAQGADVLTVVPATLPQTELERRLADTDAAVIMKLGRHLPKVRRALGNTGLLDRAIYVERGSMADAVVTPLAAKPDDAAPYFAMVLVPGWDRKP